MQAIKQHLHLGGTTGTTGASGTQTGQGTYTPVGNRVICNIQNLQLAPVHVLPHALGGSKFHPYVAIYNRGGDVAASAKTRTHKEAVGNAGPVNFNEYHTFQAHPESNIRIALWDDNLIKDKEVAEGFITYQQLISGMPVQCPLFPVTSKFNLTGNFGSGYTGGGYGSGAAGSTGTLGGSQGGAYTAGSSTIAPGTQPLAILTLSGRLENPSLATGGGVGATSAGTTGMGVGGPMAGGAVAGGMAGGAMAGQEAGMVCGQQQPGMVQQQQTTTADMPQVESNLRRPGDINLDFTFNNFSITNIGILVDHFKILPSNVGGGLNFNPLVCVHKLDGTLLGKTSGFACPPGGAMMAPDSKVPLDCILRVFCQPNDFLRVYLCHNRGALGMGLSGGLMEDKIGFCEMPVQQWLNNVGPVPLYAYGLSGNILIGMLDCRVTEGGADAMIGGVGTLRNQASLTTMAGQAGNLGSSTVQSKYPLPGSQGTETMLGQQQAGVPAAPLVVESVGVSQSGTTQAVKPVGTTGGVSGMQPIQQQQSNIGRTGY
jgi:hypothetical protein